MEQIKEYLINEIKEKHLVNEIMEMKKRMEWNQIIEDNEGNWKEISKFQTLSEEFISDNSRSVDWKYISMCQKLSEDFIENHSDLVDWYIILEYQELSDEFRNKWNHKL